MITVVNGERPVSPNQTGATVSRRVDSFVQLSPDDLHYARRQSELVGRSMHVLCLSR